MRLDLIVVKTKNNKIKIFLAIIAVVLFIACFSVLGIYHAKIYNNKLMSRKIERAKLQAYQINIKNNQIINNEEQEKIVKDIEERKHVKRTLLPVYTDNAKNKMKNIYNVNAKVAYLTFDDGPSRAVTPLILDLLKQENIKATFFILGSNLEKNEDILKREYAEGHYIANHGYSHNYSKLYNNPEKVLEEYNKTEKKIKKIIENDEYSSHLFRFPGGYYGGKYAKVKKEAAKILNDNDVSYIDWNVLTGDAEGANTKEKVMQNIKKYTKDKESIVVLMHDASTKILTYETLKDVIEYLREEGYTFDNFYSIMQ